ncbi:MAG: DUF2203 family protein [archaeon]|jgi:hypothetical protein
MGVAYFSLQGANEKVQKIRRVTERMCQLVEELDFLDNTKIELETDSTESLMLEVALNKSFHEKNLELYSLIEKLIAEGCIVRDLQSMEIDFYSRLGERSILLCWKRGEEKIQSWHETFENQTKRKPAIMLEKNYFEQLKKLR